MFKNNWNGVAARRWGRVAFGLLLVGGAGALVQQALAHDGRAVPGAALQLPAIWVVALVGAALARAIAAAWRVPRLGALPALVVPAVGVALLAPLTIHLPFVMLLGWSDTIDWWSAVAVTFLGPTHLVFAVLVAVRARGLVRGGWTPTPGWIFGATVLVSALPFAVLFLIPPSLVALTGVPILPLLQAMATLAERDREALPVAIVRSRPALV